MDLPEKLRKQLEDHIKDMTYIEYGDLRFYRAHGNWTEKAEYSKSVVKITRKMTLAQYFNPKNDENEKFYKQIFELEKKEIEYDNLKNSIETIKGFVK